MNDVRKFSKWRKSTLSNGGNDCVEVAFADDGTVAVRDSKLKESGPMLEFTRSEWDAFIGGVKANEFG